MNGSIRLALVFALAAFSQQAFAQQSESTRELRAQDVRLATVAERIQGANHALCRENMPLTGLVLHSRDQYGTADMGTAFSGGDLAVSAVIPGSLNEGTIVADDAITSIGDVAVSAMEPAEDKAPLRDAAYETLVEQPAAGPVRMKIVHKGAMKAVELKAVPGCRALVEIRSLDSLAARSDGRVVQINYGLVSQASDQDLAVIFAHELAHVVLEHRRRLSGAGVKKGFFGEFGRNQKYNRQVEVEADRLSVHLLANAGYDPKIAPAFWRSDFGQKIGGGLLKLSATYPPPAARADILDREIADYLAGGGPSWPGHLLFRRDAPFR